jgi:hypothetical protein
LNLTEHERPSDATISRDNKFIKKFILSSSFNIDIFDLGLPAKGGIQRVVGEGKGGGRGNITLVTLGT